MCFPTKKYLQAEVFWQTNIDRDEVIYMQTDMTLSKRHFPSAVRPLWKTSISLLKDIH